MPELWKSILIRLAPVGNTSGCHQMPERSFFYKGQQFPVCARCTGVTIGQAAAVIFVCRNMPVRTRTALLLLSIMGTDWCIQALHIKTSTNTRRFITGICGGFSIFILYRNILAWCLRKIFN